MSKQATKRRLADNEAQAIGKLIRTSPRKLNLVAQMIRGMHVNDALIQLTFSKKRIAKEVKKVLQSAIANAENNHDLDVDQLYVVEAIVGKALVMKRWHARARGRAAGIKKPFSNIYITVREQQEVVEEKKKVKKEKK